MAADGVKQVALDMTIVTTAIPTITHEFQNLSQVGWYGAAFFLTLAAFQSFWGKLYNFVPVKTTFLACNITFEVGSLICGSFDKILPSLYPTKDLQLSRKIVPPSSLEERSKDGVLPGLSVVATSSCRSWWSQASYRPSRESSELSLDLPVSLALYWAVYSLTKPVGGGGKSNACQNIKCFSNKGSVSTSIYPSVEQPWP